MADPRPTIQEVDRTKAPPEAQREDDLRAREMVAVVKAAVKAEDRRLRLMDNAKTKQDRTYGAGA